MRRLAPLGWRKVCQVLERAGFFLHHQKGSHLVYRHREDVERYAVVPRHRLVKVGTLRAILRQAKLTPEEFLSLRR